MSDHTTHEARRVDEPEALDLPRRICDLEKQVVEKNQALAELNDTAGAFKLLNEKHTAELNAKDILLSRKNERIDELVQDVKDRDQQLVLKDLYIERIEAKVKTLESELDGFSAQLKSEEDEFAMLSAAIETKDKQLAKKNEEVGAVKEIERQLRKDIDRLRVNVHRLERNVDELHPETSDACLSPRSFSENQLVQLRDDAIQAKTKEVWLLTGINDQLRIQLDELETELERLQTSFVSKENDVARRDRKIEKLENEIESLRVSKKQADGREKAIEIATTQNAKLLLALQQQEAMTEELAHRVQRSESECDQLRHQQRQYLEMSAVNEIEVLHKTKEVEVKSTAVSALQGKLSRERKELHQELADTRLKYQIETERLQSELVMRRNKQYELAMRLQDVEARLHDSTDELDALKEQLLATRCRMEEAERVLHDSLTWKRSLEDDISRHQQDAKMLRVAQEKQIQASEAELVTAKTQLRELKDTLVKSIDQDKKKEFRVQDLRRTIDIKDHLINELKGRTSRLIQEIASESKTRAEVELEKKLLSEQLQRLRHQMETSIRECFDQNRKLDERNRRLLDKYKKLEGEYGKERAGKSRLVAKFTDTYACVAANAAQQSDSQSKLSSYWNQPKSNAYLDLRDCWLSDLDLPPIFSMIEGPAFNNLTRVDLRSNRITQDGMRVVISYFRKKLQSGSSGVCIRELDLRSNYISLEGIRTIAGGLEGLRTTPSDSPPGGFPTIAQVYLRNGGRIECFPDEQIITKEIPSILVDISSNLDPDQLYCEPRSLNRRRSRDDDTGDVKGVVDSVKVADPLAEIYGIDLVSAFMTSEKNLPLPASGKRRISEKLRSSIAASTTTAVDETVSSGRSDPDQCVTISISTQNARASIACQSNSSEEHQRDGSRTLAGSVSLPKL